MPARIAAGAAGLRAGPGSATARGARLRDLPLAPPVVLREQALPQPQALRRHLDELVAADELDRGLERHAARGGTRRSASSCAWVRMFVSFFSR